MKNKTLEINRKQLKNFIGRLKGDILSDIREAAVTMCVTREPVRYDDRLSGTFSPVENGQKWGSVWDCAWAKIECNIPASWKNKEIALRLNFGGEMLLYQEPERKPLCGLTYHSVFAHEFNKEYCVLPPVRSAKKLIFTADVGANTLFGDKEGDLPSVGRLHCKQYGLFRRDVRDYYFDMLFLQSVLAFLPENEFRYCRVIHTMMQSMFAYAENPDNAAKAREILKKELELPASPAEISTVAVGHAHIDTAWLWPVRETIRKCGRTFSSQLRNMEQYPGYVFGASQAQLYAFTKTYYPEVYAEIKKRIAEGRWEVQGGMWVEADCNLTGGESLVRQFLHGKNFFMDEFGIDVKNLWLPDVFGYSAAMPQILKKCGCDYFLTQKISWSEFNHFPYTTFFWKGIDNTEVLTHFPPEETYNSELFPARLHFSENNFRENDILPEYMTLFGIGDGGGGPKEQHIEFGLRSANFEGLPKVKFGRADDFFRCLEEYSGVLPRWAGELYLELHRGTYTTHGRVKYLNRRCEQMLSLVEFVYSSLPAEKYPATELDRLWKVLLLNQFHDILPGSAIPCVYETTEKELSGVLDDCEKLLARTARKKADVFTAVNSLSYDYVRCISLPADWANCEILSSDGTVLWSQTEPDGHVEALGVFPPHSFVTLRKGKTIPNTVRGGRNLVLENELVRYEFNRDAVLVSAFDKECGRDVLSASGNVLSLYVDRPYDYDAWDVNYNYSEQLTENARGIRASKTVDGPVRQVLSFELEIGKSQILQEISLAANSKRLDFHTEVDWHEAHRMLRTAFPAALEKSRAFCDIQYGYQERQTHTNTSWEFAQFEVVCQRYAELSGTGYGVALLNDSKYGCRLTNETLDLALLRSPENPDRLTALAGRGAAVNPVDIADQGKHTFTYSLLPHDGSLTDSEVMQEAACLNRPVKLLPGMIAGAKVPCRVLSGNGVSLEVVKKAEKSSRTVIRLVETDGKNSRVTLALGKGRKLQETNLMEWEKHGIFPAGPDGVAALAFKPFEIRTFFLD